MKAIRFHEYGDVVGVPGQSVGRVGDDDGGLMQPDQPNQSGDHRHQCAHAERLAGHVLTGGGTRIGASEPNHLTDPQSHCGQVEFTVSSRRYLVRIVAGIAGFDPARAVTAEDEHAPPSIPAPDTRARRGDRRRLRYGARLVRNPPGPPDWASYPLGRPVSR
jgi:hypothetical protein